MSKKLEEQLVVVFNKCVKTESFLQKKGFRREADEIIDIEVAEPLKLIINLEGGFYCWCDSEGYVDRKRAVKSKYDITIKTTTLKELKSCLK